MVLQFKPITLQDKPLLAPYLEKNPARICDITVGNTVFWRDYCRGTWALYKNTLCLGCDCPERGILIFGMPRGPQLEEVLDALAELAVKEKKPLVFCPLSGEEAAALLRRWPDAFSEQSADWEDYLYAAEDLRTLAGRRFGGQRNHINRFKKENPDWRFEKITAANAPAVSDFFAHYLAQREKTFSAAAEESAKTFEVLENWEAYGYCGGVLYADGQIQGFALGEIAGDTLYVHVEKASLERHGAYPMLVQQMALLYTPGGDGCVCYINREDDAGDEGLRTVKQSYHPIEMVQKYRVTAAPEQLRPRAAT